jgi:hypothetical protein
VKAAQRLLEDDSFRNAEKMVLAVRNFGLKISLFYIFLIIIGRESLFQNGMSLKEAS